MLIFVLLLSFIAGRSIAFSCDETRKCDEYSTIQELSDLNFTPNREQLLNLCPRTLQFFDCFFEEVQKCTVLSLPELAGTGHELASEMLRTKNLIVDICNEDSSLHKDYAASIECIRDVTNAQSPVCKDDTEKVVKGFLESRSLLDAGKDEEFLSEEQLCLEMAYTLACFSEDINKNCGETARRVYLTVLEHSKSVAAIECSIEDDLSLKREFLDYLDLKEDDKTAYWSVFQTFRR
ncbi:hypothetical protein AVEN_75582-1 [Araneus ventricosus]|uniref:DUF19 domain-containing protein n=1 Tax=Araneus ventricosus TaxID=182803 RepID=A0A4Y2CMU8_ARAVE|nr:hypothetical protein AVEN_75582-1 [Araneus ventricosus]